jgi:hypothetical protein
LFPIIGNFSSRFSNRWKFFQALENRKHAGTTILLPKAQGPWHGEARRANKPIAQKKISKRC